MYVGKGGARLLGHRRSRARWHALRRLSFARVFLADTPRHFTRAAGVEKEENENAHRHRVGLASIDEIDKMSTSLSLPTLSARYQRSVPGRELLTLTVTQHRQAPCERRHAHITTLFSLFTAFIVAQQHHDHSRPRPRRIADGRQKRKRKRGSSSARFTGCRHYYRQQDLPAIIITGNMPP